MRNLKRIIAATTMAMVLLIGSTFANDGIIVLGAKTSGTTRTTEPKSQPCTDKSATGIIVTDLTGIIVLGFTGIIVTDFAGCTPTDTKSSSATGIIVLG